MFPLRHELRGSAAMTFDDDDIPEQHVIPEAARTPEGSSGRYDARVRAFLEDKRKLPRLRHEAYWLIHNLVAHPLLTIPVTPALELHELTSQWLNKANEPTKHTAWRHLRIERPVIPHPIRWIFHNTVAHAAIGLFPCRLTFKLHDWSARWMNVKGWV